MKKLRKVLCIMVTMTILLTSNALAYASPKDSTITDATQYVETYFNERGQAENLEYLRSIMTDQRIASQLINKSMFITKINEYEEAKKIQSISINELIKMGYTEKNIANIKQTDYKKMAEEYKKLSDEELKSKGFSSEKISALRSYDGSEQALIASTPDINIIVWYDIDYCYYSTSLNRTYAKVQYNWSWNSYPWGYWDSDMVAFAWSEFMYLTSSSDATCTVGYFTIDNNQFRTFESQPTIINNPNGSCYFSFIFRKTFTPTGIEGYSKNGSGVIKISKSGKVAELGMTASYGHTTASGTPSVNFGGPPSVSISFSSCMSYTTPKYIYLSTIPSR